MDASRERVVERARRLRQTEKDLVGTTGEEKIKRQSARQKAREDLYSAVDHLERKQERQGT